MLKNSYWSFVSALSKNECNDIIQLGVNKIIELEKKGICTTGKTFGDSDKESKKNAIPINDDTIENKNIDDYYVRDSKICWLNEKWIYDLITPYIFIANENAGWDFDVDCFEDLQFTTYGVNQFYGWHADGDIDKHASLKRFYPGVNGFELSCPKKHTIKPEFVGKVRKISMTINLTLPSEYEGGNLKFDFGPHSHGDRFHNCTEIRPQGSIIVFPSFINHQVTPVTKGTRYSLVLWSNGKPFK
jgi:PKHD-type hydroxylase